MAEKGEFNKAVPPEDARKIHQAIVDTRPFGDAVLTGWVVASEWALPDGIDAVAFLDGPDNNMTHIRRMGLIEHVRNKLRRE